MASNSIYIDVKQGVHDIRTEVNDDEEETLSDGDDCDEDQLKHAFKKSYTICTETALSLDIVYVLHMDYKRQKICLGLSNNTSEIYEFSDNKLNKLCELNEHKSCIINVKFAEENTVYTGSSDGTIKQWDLRTPQKSIHSFIDTSTLQSEHKKVFSCFDVSPNNRVICAGTELYEGDSFMIFWDVRNTKLLGGYWESHMDDVTKVLFHPTNVDRLASCSTDGLINIYDLKNTSEDDALETSLNTESSVEQLLWIQKDNKDALASVTHPSEVMLWSVEDAIPYAKFSRTILSKEIKRKSPEHCYVANMHTNATYNNVFILTGSNWHNGEIVRGLGIVNNQLQPAFTLENNRQRLRSSYYIPEEELLITGGEQGIISVWKPGEPEPINPIKGTKNKIKLHSQKPY